MRPTDWDPNHQGQFCRKTEIETEWGETLVLRELTAYEATELWPQLEAVENPDRHDTASSQFDLYAGIVIAGVINEDLSPRWSDVHEVFELPARILADLAMRILALSEINLEEPPKKNDGPQDDG